MTQIINKKKHVIIYTVDIHGSEKLYKALFKISLLENANSIVIGGDILPKYSTDDLIEVQKKFIRTKLIQMFKKFKKENPSVTVYLMMGNDDFKVNMTLLEDGARKGYFKLLDMKVHKLNNQFNICGYSHVPPLPFLMKDWQKHDTKKTRGLSDECDEKFRELIICKDEQRKKLEKEYLLLLSELGYTRHIHHYTVEGLLSAEKNDETTIEDNLKSLAKKSNPKKTIFVIHAPPWNTNLDMVYPDGSHIGSKAVREFIEREQPMLTLHGHAHESYEITGQFKEVVGKTVSINPGSEYNKDKLNAVIFDVYNLKCMNNIKLEDTMKGIFTTCLNCMDGRVQLPVIQWIKENYSTDYVDMITDAGMDGVLAGENHKDIKSILKKIDISLKRPNLHLNIIFVAGHHDCLGNPVDDETHKRQISIAAEKLKNLRPSAQIIGLWVSDEWKVEKITEK